MNRADTIRELIEVYETMNDHGDCDDRIAELEAELDAIENGDDGDDAGDEA